MLQLIDSEPTPCPWTHHMHNEGKSEPEGKSLGANTDIWMKFKSLSSQKAVWSLSKSLDL